MSERSPTTQQRTVPWPGMIMTVISGRSAHARPPVLASELGRTLRFDGRRLGVLGNGSLEVKCTCGHSGRVPLADLIARHGENARLRDVVIAMRCSACGSRQIREVRWHRCSRGRLPANTDRVPVQCRNGQ